MFVAEQPWVPASEAVIASLPVLHRTGGDEKARDADANERRVCVICREALGEQQPATRLSCAHEFHYECAVSWLQRCAPPRSF